MIKIYFITFTILTTFLNNISFSDEALVEAIQSKNRTANYVLRDSFRNPLETLSFFGIKNDMKVIELQPSGGNSPGGWYTEILAPFLKTNGLLIAAHFDPRESDWRARMRKGYEERIKYEKDFNKIQMAVLSMPCLLYTSPSPRDS